MSAVATVSADDRTLGPMVRPLRLDGGLRQAIPAEARALADRAVTVPSLELPEGSWSPQEVTDDRRPTTGLVLDGVLCHEIVLAGRGTVHLHGSGDLVRPWGGARTVLPSASRWRVGEDGATLAVLDATFAKAQRQWPSLAAAVRQRLADQADELALRIVIASLPRVEQRLLAMFWQLADRWGVVRPEGVTIALGVSHELLGRLIGAKRPTVSLALQELATSGMLTRMDAREWRLSHESLATLDGGDGSPMHSSFALSLVKSRPVAVVSAPTVAVHVTG